MNRNIGDKVTAKFAYNRKCSDRFVQAYETDKSWILKPKLTSFEGYIVGQRCVIMSDFKPTYGEDYGQGYVSGKHEHIWLVAKSIKHEPLIVRESDIL